MSIWRKIANFGKLLRDSFFWSVEGRLEQAFLRQKNNISIRVLAVGFVAIFIAVTVIAWVVVYRTHSQIGTEARLMLRERGALISQLLGDRLNSVLEEENRRSFSHYRFMMTIPSLGRENTVLSPLAQYPIQSDIPGLLGYYQIDPNGSFHTPILPEERLERYPVTDRSARIRHARRIEMIVRQSDVIGAAVVERVAVQDLIAEKEESSETAETDFLSEEEAVVTLPIAKPPRIEEQSEKQSRIFDPEGKSFKHGFYNVEIHPFDALVSDKYLIFRRNVFRGNERYIQGFILSIPSCLIRIFQNDIAYDFMNDVGVRVSAGGTRVLEIGEWGTESEVLRYTLAWPFQDILLDVAYQVPRRGEATAAIALVSTLFLIGFGAALLLLYRGINASIKTAQKRGDFISAVTHELRTPLTGITTNIDILTGDYPVPEEDKQIIYQRISAETARLARLIDNVLNISRLEKRRLVVHPIYGSIDELVRRFADQFGIVYQNKNFELRLELTTGDRQFLFDPDAMTQVLVNVVDNAVKFSIKAEVRFVEVKTRLTPDGGAILSVRDYGSGVPEEELSSIFKPFYRAENELVRSTNGTGIGLSLVRGFCDLMKIRPQARNASPGLEVSFLFPPPKERKAAVEERSQEWGDE